jgi:hypothetical protein
MNIFINLYNGWTVYEWILLGSSLLLIFLLSNLATYLLTKDWSFNKVLSLTYPITSVLYIILVFLTQFLPVSMTHVSLIPIFVIPLLVTVNWSTLITYYSKFKDSKSFSKSELFTEYRKDSIRNIVFLTMAVLAASIFLRGELLSIFLISYLVTAFGIYINTVLVQRFVHD